MQEAGFEVDVLNVTKDGIVDLENLKKLMREDTILVSICCVDSELGIRQPIEEIASIVKKNPHTIFHTDAAQSIGKVSIDFSNVDLVTIAPHKFYGLNGFGILIKKKEVSIKPIIHGGKSTTVYRSGTPVLGNILAIDKALDIAISKQAERYDAVLKMNQEVRDFLKNYKNVFVNSTNQSIPFTLNFSIKGVKSDRFAKLLEEKGIYLSTKTSCCPVGTPSKLVFALTHDKALASSSLRISFSHLTTEAELKEFYQAFEECIKEVS